jgi:hypothetical protein
LADFPPTIRDAVIVTRRLGVQYLWIVSLCIVQDDLDDWSAESTKMGDVYENGYATRNCADGLAPAAADLDIARQRFRTFHFHENDRGAPHEIFLSTQLAAYPSSLGAALLSFRRSSINVADTRLGVAGRDSQPSQNLLLIDSAALAVQPDQQMRMWPSGNHSRKRTVGSEFQCSAAMPCRPEG